MLTHQARSTRRRLIADAVRGGATPTEVAEMFTVSLPTVYLAMKQAGVSPPTRVRTKGARRRTAESMLRAGTPGAVIARRLGVSRQRVSQIKKGMGRV